MLPSHSLPLPSWFSNDWTLRQAFTGRIPSARECETTLQQHIRTSASSVSPVSEVHSLNSLNKHFFSASESTSELTEINLQERPSGRSLLLSFDTPGGDWNLAAPPASSSQNCHNELSAAVEISKVGQKTSDSREEPENGMQVDMHIHQFRDHSFEWEMPAAAALSGTPISTLLLASAKREPQDLDNSSGGDMSAMTMSNVTSASGEASVSSGSRDDGLGDQHQQLAATQTISNSAPQQVTALKKKRSLPGTPDPDAEVIALSPRTLLATNRFVCEICNKGFQRDQNLQLHRRGHNLPWKLKQRSSKEIRKRVYICPEQSCVHHDPARALGDLTGIKKHFCRKHGEKKWKCDKCAKRYAVQSDWKAHMKTCGTREYRCDCGTLFSRRDSFITHRAFCDALAEENGRVSVNRPGEGQSLGAPESLSGLSSTSDQVSLALLGASSSLHGSGSFISSTASRPAMRTNIAGLSFGDTALASLTSRWDPRAMGLRSGPGMTSTNPRLSLWLGTGPGSGPPPGSFHQMTGEGGSHMQHSLNQAEGSLSDDLTQPPRVMHNALPMMGMRESSDFHNMSSASKMSSGMTSLLQPPGSVSFFASDNGMPGSLQNALLGHQEVANTSHNADGAASLSYLSSPGPMSSSPRCGTASVSIMHGQEQQLGANAQMSATALLQKAAIIGATASNPAVLRNFGMGSQDSRSMVLGGAMQTSRHEQGRDSTNLFATSMSPYSSFPTGIQGFADPLQSLSPGRVGSSRGGSSTVQDLVNSLAGNAGLFSTGLNNLPSGNTSGMIFPNDHQKFLNIHSFGERAMLPPGHILCGSPQSPAPRSLSHGQLGAPQLREDGDHKPTLDFLGLGGAAGMVGQAFSHRDIANIMCMGGDMEFLSSTNDQKDNLMAEDVSRNSPEKSWDSSN